MRKLAIFFVLTALGTAAAFASETEEVLATVGRFGQIFQLNNTQQALGTCAKNITIVDDLSPFLWHGPGSCARWLSTIKAFVKKSGMANSRIELLRPMRTLVSGNHAYVVVPIGVSYTDSRGKESQASVLLTLVLQKVSARWYIVASAISAH